MKNWFGRESHPSDELIHWSDRSSFERGWKKMLGSKTFKTFDEYVDELRAAWDLLYGDLKTHAATELLMEAQRHISDMEEGEREAGEDL
jgi:RNAse (barnase) inhibitor barstar